ncbi:H(+)-transporting V0 sector ATPase subunit e [Geranomyces variabilis]|uniref:H(+)-transporting V0 sector ATPase subunit e n=1 Tax=Geranomyces variabilis TaxID=109894 RepID=A0AAD5TJK2_9FUNG|nr:H(+)-transporting V0 sector ATPase subunit e [Geranomyces variabilis]
MAGAAIIVMFLLFAIAGAIAFYYIPHSPDQILYRTSLTLTLVCTYTMWAVTYLAQMNPLIVPERSFGHNSTTAPGSGHQEM